ncbi:MAG: Gfo/Idh/MocA family oxidoreductase [Pirellulales bacterium]|nr:Gfo/Idh/MocA family oxidoreductase [Pirellulales bacterium]
MMNKPGYPTRRDFLKTSSAVLAGATLAGQLGLARGAHAAEGDAALKVALIGCGGRGNGAAHDCLGSCPNTKLVAVADAFADNAQNSAKGLKEAFGDRVDLPSERVFSGFDAYQKAIDCGVDMVLLATPPGFRPIHYKAAIEAGKHVFMEKPCCVDAPGFRSLMDTNKLADEKSLKVGVGLQRHHQQSYIETLKRIQDGAIGDIGFFRVYWNGGGLWNNRRQPNQTEMEYQMRNWYYFVWLCGDHICEQHVHNMDIANWVKGAHPVEANGMGGREVRKFGPDGDFGQIYDHHVVEFTYADGTKMFSQCRHINNAWSEVREFAHGTKGLADCSGRIEGENKWRFRKEGSNPYTQEHVDLMDAILNNKKYNEGYHGATSSMTAVLGRMATYSGKIVKWDDAVAKGPDEMPKTYAWDANPPVLPDEKGSYEHAVPVPGIYQPY